MCETATRTLKLFLKENEGLFPVLPCTYIKHLYRIMWGNGISHRGSFRRALLLLLHGPCADAVVARPFQKAPSQPCRGQNRP